MGKMKMELTKKQIDSAIEAMHCAVPGLLGFAALSDERQELYRKAAILAAPHLQYTAPPVQVDGSLIEACLRAAIEDGSGPCRPDTIKAMERAIRMVLEREGGLLGALTPEEVKSIYSSPFSTEYAVNQMLAARKSRLLDPPTLTLRDRIQKCGILNDKVLDAIMDEIEANKGNRKRDL